MTCASTRPSFGEALVRLESFVDRYPEIDRVAYFSKDGEALFSVNNEEASVVVEDLPQSRLDDATAVVGDSKPYLMNGGILDPRQFEILAPVWVESLPDDGLFAFDDEDQAVAGIDAVAGDFPHHSAAAVELANEYFGSDAVLTDLLRKTGLMA